MWTVRTMSGKDPKSPLSVRDIPFKTKREAVKFAMQFRTTNFIQKIDHTYLILV